jgi:hypothetical protein
MFTHRNTMMNGGSDFCALLAVNDSLAHWITSDKPLSELSPTRCLVQQPRFVCLTSLSIASAVVALQMFGASVAAASD